MGKPVVEFLVDSEGPEFLEESSQKERISAERMPKNFRRLLRCQRLPVFRQMLADELPAICALERRNAQFAPFHFRQNGIANPAVEAGGNKCNSLRQASWPPVEIGVLGHLVEGIQNQNENAAFPPSEDSGFFQPRLEQAKRLARVAFENEFLAGNA